MFFHRSCISPIAIIALAAGGLSGCQSYQRKPLDGAAHDRAFVARTPEAPGVAALAKRLAAIEPQTSYAFDPSDGISRPEAEVIALVFNADLRMARLRAGVAAASASTAGLWQDPVLGTDLSRIIQSTQHPWKMFTSIGFTIPISGRLDIEKQRAGAEHAAELTKVFGDEWRTRMELRRAWAEWTATVQRLEVTREFFGRVDHVLGLVDRIEKAGEIARIESRLFRVERATRSAELKQLEADATASELAIKRIMGLAPATSLRLVSGQVGQTERPATDVLWEMMQRGSPPLALARAEYEVAERALELEIRKQYPDLTIGPGYGREDGQDQFLLNLSVPIPILNRNKQGIARATAERELSQAAFESAMEGLASDLESAALGLSTAATQRRAFEEDIVPMVDQQYADSRRVAQLGEFNALVLLETLKTQQEAKGRLIDARLAEWLAAIRLDELVGPEPAPPTIPSPNPVDNAQPVRSRDQGAKP